MKECASGRGHFCGFPDMIIEIIVRPAILFAKIKKIKIS